MRNLFFEVALACIWCIRMNSHAVHSSKHSANRAIQVFYLNHIPFTINTRLVRLATDWWCKCIYSHGSHDIVAQHFLKCLKPIIVLFLCLLSSLVMWQIFLLLPTGAKATRPLSVAGDILRVILDKCKLPVEKLDLDEMQRYSQCILMFQSLDQRIESAAAGLWALSEVCTFDIELSCVYVLVLISCLF